MGPGRRIAYLILIVAIIVSFLYYYSRIVTIIPGKYVLYLDAALVITTSILLIRFIRPYIDGTARKFVGRGGISLINFIFDTVVYFVMAVSVLSIFGINLYQVILGSTFLAAVLGLATQSVLSNMLTGLMLEVSRPFRVGDEVFISSATSGSNYMTFQYSVLTPKYFSNDTMYSQGVRGRVVDISINYTYIQSADGTLTLIPNGNMVYGAIELLGKDKYSRIRYEVPKSVDPINLRRSLEGILRDGTDGPSPPLEILIDETTLNTYVISIMLPEDMREGTLGGALKLLENMRARPLT